MSRLQWQSATTTLSDAAFVADLRDVQISVALACRSFGGASGRLWLVAGGRIYQTA